MKRYKAEYVGFKNDGKWHEYILADNQEEAEEIAKKKVSIISTLIEVVET